MNATVLAPGSRGDVQPYIALGQALRTLGHGCTVVTTADHESLVRSYGLEVAVVPVNVAAALQQVETRTAVEGGGVLSSFREFAALAKRAARSVAEVALEASRGADVVVTNFGTLLVADALSGKLGVPVVQAFNVPLTETAAFPGALFPGLDFGGLSRRLSHRLTRAALWMTARSSANQACIELLGARPAPLFPPSAAGLMPGPVLYGLSDAFLPRPADWASEAQYTGFWFVEEASDFQPPADLATFLDEGPPPVCIGFGSMAVKDPEKVGAIAVEAARAAGQRLVLLSGWAGLQAGQLSADAFVLQGVPHAWLFPRCSVVVHHGGAGTTAAAARAGVPAVVVPFHGDQPFWASRVQRLGVGPAPVPYKKLTAPRLTEAISRAAGDEAIRQRAAEVGQLLRAEQGALKAAAAIVEAAQPGHPVRLSQDH